MKFKNALCGLAGAVALQLGMLAGSAQTGAVFTSLYSFTGTNDGSDPNGLVQGSDGNFYGTTGGGGTNNLGTVFKITSTGALTSLYSFTGTNDGANPDAGLVQGSDGNFYSTTEAGGTNGLGTVFKITTNGALTSLYSFTGGNDGAYPLAGLVQGSDGNFYGSTAGQAFYVASAIFKISTNGVLTTLHTFSPPFSGNPSRLAQGSDGSFYGTTRYGGGNFNSDGTVFNISTNGALTNLYSFSGNDGVGPNGLVQGSDGNFYGITGGGGTNNAGTVFRLTIQPQLTMTVSGANVILSWPTNYAGWYLQKTVNLGAAGFVRITLLALPVIVNGRFVVTLPITDTQPGFYRLSSQ